jgi:putative transposase
MTEALGPALWHLFTPTLVPKHERRLGGLSDVIISLYAGGMTTRDIATHLARVYGTEISADTVSTVTEAVLDEVKLWQIRPLDARSIRSSTSTR